MLGIYHGDDSSHSFIRLCETMHLEKSHFAILLENTYLRRRIVRLKDVFDDKEARQTLESLIDSWDIYDQIAELDNAPKREQEKLLAAEREEMAAKEKAQARVEQEKARKDEIEKEKQADLLRRKEESQMKSMILKKLALIKHEPKDKLLKSVFDWKGSLSDDSLHLSLLTLLKLGETDFVNKYCKTNQLFGEKCVFWQKYFDINETAPCVVELIPTDILLYWAEQYENGQGVYQDNEEAIKWYQIALGKGNKKAARKVQKLTS
jgi:Membrane protein involved in colicin uptake